VIDRFYLLGDQPFARILVFEGTEANRRNEMKLYTCSFCKNVVYFENRFCGQCGHQLGYASESDSLWALERTENGAWNTLGGECTPRYLCANAVHDVCNWLAPPDASSPFFCSACRHNRVIPNVDEIVNLLRWRQLELAKHRLFYSLLRWSLPLQNRTEAVGGLAFDFLADPPAIQGPKVMTGHDEGLITIALSEADDATREQRRIEMGEPYRTLLGHFRHEIGHYYWNVLVRDGGKQDSCREIFGDDREDYQASLSRHYGEGPPPDWQDNFVSAYATTHPWEDFAETWAHYLHIVDTLEMASAFGLHIEPSVDRSGDFAADLDFDPYVAGTILDIVRAWLPFVFAMNNVNRSMGQLDLYPFVLAPKVVEKLGFIHALI
jgi:hypothetical protein